MEDIIYDFINMNNLKYDDKNCPSINVKKMYLSQQDCIFTICKDIIYVIKNKHNNLNGQIYNIDMFIEFIIQIMTTCLTSNNRTFDNMFRYQVRKKMIELLNESNMYLKK